MTTALNSSNLPATFSVANAKLPQSYESAKTALASCASIDECQEWADKAAALAAYARMADDQTLRKTCDRIQARAVRRMGELLKQIEPQQGKRTDVEPSGGAPTRLEVAKDAGMSRDQMHTALRVASVPQQEFERQVESETPSTVTKLAALGTQKRPTTIANDLPHGGARTEARPDGFAAATNLIGTVEDFAEFCRSQNPETIAAAVMPHEVTDLREHVATIDSWLDRFVVNLRAE